MTSMVRSEESMTMKNNQEEILDALTDFERRPSKEIPAVLEQFLRDVAQTGETLFPWSRVKVLFKWKLEQVMTDFNEDSPIDHLPAFPNVENIKFEEYRRRILAAVERFHGVPFTIQRLCELITEPKKHYKRSDKFLRGIEKNVLVVSTVDPLGKREVSECKMLVNGLDTNGCSPKSDRPGEEDHGIPEVQAMVPIQPESSDNVSTKWPMSIPAISVPGPTLLTASSALSPCTTTSTSSQDSSSALAATLTEEEREEKVESASNGLQSQEEEMEEREIASGETDSQSSSSDDSLPFAPAEASQASEQPSSNSEAEESQPAGSKGHSDQDSSITTSDGAAEVSMQWPGHSMTVNNSAEASACPPSSSPPQALGPPSEVTISTSNSASPTGDPDLPPSDKSNNAESEAEARSASPLGEEEEEREDSSQGECADECGTGQQQQCEVDSSESTDSDRNGHKNSSAEELACPENNGDLTDSAGAEVSVSSSELAEQGEEHSAQAPSSADGAEAEAPVEMEQEREEEDRQQEPTQSEEEPMEQD